MHEIPVLPESFPTLGQFVPTPLPAIDPDEFCRFRDALPDRAARLRIGLHLCETDARLLTDHPEWQETHYRQWVGQHVLHEPGAPVGLERLIEAEVEAVEATPVRRPSHRPGKSRAGARRPRPVQGDRAA